jgi:hypothetical protein
MRDEAICRDIWILIAYNWLENFNEKRFANTNRRLIGKE